MLKNPFFKFFASLKLAVISILTLAGVLAYGTIAESLFGTRGAHVLVYGTWWFAGVLALLAANVFCAALSRYPWKRHQTGFVITHLGILTLLFGSLVTQWVGVDGNLPIVEGSRDSEVLLSDLRLTIVDEATGSGKEYAVPESHRATTGRLLEISFGPERRLVMDTFIPRAVLERHVVKSPVPGLGMPALKVQLFNKRFRVEEWLLASHPERGAELSLGPANLSFRKLWNEGDEKAFFKDETAEQSSKKQIGYLIVDFEGRQGRVDIDGALNSWRLIPGFPLSVKIDRYLPYAIVEKGELVSRSKDPVNPAVQLLIKDGNGREEKHTVFANFPEFSTLHKAHQKDASAAKSIGVKFRMVSGALADSQMAFVGSNRGKLQFALTADNQRLLYRVVGASGKENSRGEVRAGDTVPTGWMDLNFKVTEWFPSAIEQEVPRAVDYISGMGDNFTTSIHLVEEIGPRIAKGDANASPNNGPSRTVSQAVWINEGSGTTISMGSRNYELRFGKSRLTLPFGVNLSKFTIGTDPGTTKAATYESNVVVKDPTNGVERKALISMNEPLDYGGYTLYQASYVMQEGRPPISVFSVNYDPGRRIKYLGALCMVFGILTMFYMNPHYWDILFRRKERETA